MLARLDEINGVTESRVDWTGKRFLLQLESSANQQRVLETATAALGDGAYALDREETRAALDALRKGEAWMRAGETLRLSRHEAEVLAKRYGEEAAKELGLDGGSTRKLVAIFERELNVAFDRTHAAKSGDRVRIQSEVAQAGKRILEASRALLSSEQQVKLEEYLGRFSGPGGR